MVLLLALTFAAFFAIAKTPPNPRGNRLSNLDGLRGFVAFGVFFHHGAIYHQYLQDGQWASPPSTLLYVDRASWRSAVFHDYRLLVLGDE